MDSKNYTSNYPSNYPSATTDIIDLEMIHKQNTCIGYGWRYLLLMVAVLSILGSPVGAQNRYTISGYVKEAQSKESLPSVNVYLPELGVGAATNSYGFYSLSLEEGTYVLLVSAVGFTQLLDTLDVQSDMTYNVDLEPATYQLESVEVSGKVERETQTSQMGKINLDPKTVESLPTLLGEKDVIKVLQLLPGVQSGSEGFSGFYVRGGGPDQNLFILDDAVVYNANHLFGFFSVFNGDAVKSIEFFKGGFPARYGGRLSSVLDVKLKEGHANKVHGKVGVGLLSTQVVIEGPIKKEKVSFLVSGRRTYFDLLLRGALLLAGNSESFGYTLQDYNAKINYDINDKHKIYLSGYSGSDIFSQRINISPSQKERFSVRWGNITGTLRWNFNFSPIAFSNLTATASNYNFRIRQKDDSDDAAYEYNYLSNVANYGIKYDVDIFPSLNHSLKTGFLVTYHRFSPNTSRVVVNDENIVDDANLFEAIEQAIYIEDEIRYGRFLGNIGVRISGFTHKNRWYIRPEPRISLGVEVGWATTIKASYAMTNQYIHLLSNSSASLPTDLWVPSTNRIGPQNAQQVSLGAAKEIGREWTVSVEGYFKWARDIIDYLDGARFINISQGGDTQSFDWESQVDTGISRAYGVEVLLRKNIGKITGWVGYTFLRVQNTFPRINEGIAFSPVYDRRHDVSVVLMYSPTDRTSLSGTWIYGTGNTFTAPAYVTRSPSVESPLFEVEDLSPNFLKKEASVNRNNARGEAYHRMDLNAQFSKKVGKRKQNTRVWQVGIYNVYSRINPFAYTLGLNSSILPDTPESTDISLTRVGLFPIIPYVTFRYEF